MKMATLVVTGSMVEALEALIARRILSAASTVEHPAVFEECTKITKIRVDAGRYEAHISAWLNEPVPQPLEAGVLLRAVRH